MVKNKTLHVADLFCGGGGASTGMMSAFRKAGVDCTFIGVNHWSLAIDTNKANHEGAYYCAPVEGVEPTDLVEGGVLDILWASPECTNHSRAKGGMPRQNQSRCQPELLLPWIRKLLVRRLYVENVPEFLEWGPLLAEDTVIDGKLYKAGTPDPRRKTVFFKDWVESIRRSGYRVDWRILNAADYGAATSRERLVVQAVRTGLGEKIAWPIPTHRRVPDLAVRTPWRPAASIIDWSIKGESIFHRKRPLKPNTLKRIENGIRKYWGEWAEPFIVLMRGTKDYQLDCTAKPIGEPLPTISAGGIHAGVVQPFLCTLRGTTDSALDRTAQALDRPVPTITANGKHFGVVSPEIRPFVVDLAHTKSNRTALPPDSPLNTITCTHGTHGVVSPLFVPQQSAGTAKPVTNPLPTISTTGAISVVEPLVHPYYGSATSCKPVTNPLDTIPTKAHFGLLEGQVLRMEDGTEYMLDITFRMLQPHELAAAMSFPEGYKFCGNKTEQIKQIGNAVCPKLSEALISAALSA